ncbi:hypothetical protein KJ953_02840 [Patescibacteria group bacterium]|nr:hypothetical protein [Patescibacteria group bacterium]
MSQFIKENKFILALVFLVFLPSLFTFFSGDDWSHLRLSQISSFSEFFNFFSFSNNAQTASFYRPLSTQVFFFIFQTIFGLNSFFYHIFVMAGFFYSLYLLHSLCLILFKNKLVANVSLIIYAVSATNFTRLYFLSAFQEILMVIFILSSLIYFATKKYQRSLIFFILALMSKETAIVLPAILLAYSILFNKKINIKKHLWFWIISAVYLCFRFFIFKLPVGDSYIFSFSPKSILNTLFWYVTWSFGTPELLVDYISSGLKPIPRLFTDYPTWSYIMLTGTVTLVSYTGYIFAKTLRSLNKKHLFSALLFLVSISPLLLLPWHKFTLELGLPLVGFSMFVSLLLVAHKKDLKTFLVLFIIFNLLTNYLTYTRHYSVGRSKISTQISEFLKNNYPTYPEDSYFEFINDTQDYGATWGSSKQISHTISSSDMFKVFYNNHTIQVFFEDDTEAERPTDKKQIKISTKQFFK